MASGLLKIAFQTINTSKRASQLQHSTTPFLFLPLLLTQNHHHYSHLSLFPSKPLHTTKIFPLPVYSSITFSTPPTTKEEAILQAKTSLSTTLEKPLNNPKLAGKLKKLKQPRFRVELPVIDDFPDSLSQLALKVLGEMPIRRKGSLLRF